jgi:hypothetical protein
MKTRRSRLNPYVSETLAIVDDNENIAGLNGLTLLGGHPGDATGFGGLEFVLHLHGLDDDEALLGSDLIADRDEHSDDAAGHRSFDGPGAIRTGARGSAGAQGAGIIERKGDAGPVDEDSVTFGRGVEDAAKLARGVERKQR